MVTRASKLAITALALVTLLGVVVAGIEQSGAAASAKAGPARGEGAVFAMTNRSSGNAIVTYRRSPSGALTRMDTVSTRGLGLGTDLDTQGPLQLSDDHRLLYAVNAGSDDITVFAVNGPHLTFLQKVYAGDAPNSVTLHRGLAYVLDGSVAGNGIRGFRVAANGTLTPIPDSFRALSSPIAVPGQVAFSPDGRLLLVTEKTTNLLLSPASAIDTFAVGHDGLASTTPRRDTSHGIRPFSVAFRGNDQLLVAESFDAMPGRAAVSSYDVSASGDLNVVSGSIPNRQTDSCWVVVTNDGQYAYTANFGSGTISSYTFSGDGHIHVIKGNAAFLGAKSQPVDLALSGHSRYLYLLLRGTGAVATFAVQDNGRLLPLGVVTGGLPVADGASGLAAY